VSLDELERAFRERHTRTGARLVMVPMQIAEADVRALTPRLQSSLRSPMPFTELLLILLALGVGYWIGLGQRHQ
jgi:hypothetical protein